MRAKFLAPGTFFSFCCTLGLYGPWWRAKTLIITDQRVIMRKGVFSKDDRNVQLSRIQDIAIKRSFLGRILGYGNIRIETAGSGATEIVFNNIDSPTKVRDLIYEQTARLEESKAV